jgi:hypothetical protein
VNKRKIVIIAVLCASLAIGGAVRYHAVGYSDNVGVTNGLVSKAAPAPVSESSAAGEVSIASVNGISGIGPHTLNSPEELAALSQMDPISESDALALFMDRKTTEIAVKDKRDGYVWFSNPVGHNNDPIASPLYKSELQSQLLLTYYNEKGQVYNFNSFDDSVQKKQFVVTKTDKGVKVVYQFGKVSGGTDNVPAMISKERFDNLILAKLKDDDTRKQVNYKFHFNQQKQVYELRNLQDSVMQELAGYLASAGYTKEDAAKDNKDNGVAQEAVDDQAQFTVPVEYSLDGGQLVVTIHAKEVKYSPAFPLASVQVLKHFGAADDKKEGYIFVPDGSGALIYLNNQKLSAEPYNIPVYGEDGTFDVKERVLTSAPARLPVFGMKQNDHALLGIIENGDAMASISADISGRYDSYNSVNSKFQFVAMDFYTLSSGTKTSSVPMFQKKPYQGDIRIRYTFLSGSSADYVGMAGAYRDYLVNKYKLTKLPHKVNSPFILELEGAFRKQKSFFGIRYETTESLTTYDQAVKILSMLKDQGVDDISLRYVGWFNDGIRHGSPKDISLEGALGGKRKFQELIDYSKQNHIGLYPDVAFLEKYKSSDGSANFLDRRKAAIYEYDPVMYVADKSLFSHYVLSASKLSGVVDGFITDFTKLGIGGVSLRDMGDEVNSDFNPGTPVSRQDALDTIVRETGKLQQEAGSLMVNGGNAYLLPYSDMIVNAPTASNRMNITDEDVMFYQIALHGYLDLSGAPFNMDQYQNPRVSMLKALETGSNIFYQWYYNDASAVKDTVYNGLYALHYEDWFDEAVKTYKEANTVLKDVRDQTIVGHRMVADQVVQTTFENGRSIIINYNKTAVQVDGKTIDAESYRLGGE